MTLDSYAYQDPEKVLIRKQEAEARKKANCGDCIYHTTLVLYFNVEHGCAKRNKYGYQCTYYETKKERI